MVIGSELGQRKKKRLSLMEYSGLGISCNVGKTMPQTIPQITMNVCLPMFTIPKWVVYDIVSPIVTSTPMTSTGIRRRDEGL